MSIREIARQAARDADKNADGFPQIDRIIREKVADAVAVAVLREVRHRWDNSPTTSDSGFWITIDNLLAAFTPAEPLAHPVAPAEPQTPEPAKATGEQP